jgi:hypothetical protein
VGPPHLAHAAATQQLHQSVATERRSVHLHLPGKHGAGASKRWWVVVGLGWGRPDVAQALGPSGQAGVVILSAFGGDAVGAVLGAGAALFGHHRAPLGALVQRWISFGCRYTTGAQAQTREQQRAARCGDTGSRAGEVKISVPSGNC